MLDLKIEYMPVEQLAPYAGNARTHSPGQVQQIARSMKQFGFMSPVIVDAKKVLIAGHGRFLAAQHLGLARVPVVRCEHLTEAQARAYRLADNKLAENAGWDKNLLRVELDFLMSADINFDVDLTGYNPGEINLIINPTSDPIDDTPAPEPPAAAETVSRAGDVWVLGRHRIACGDSRDEQLVATLLAGEQARMVFSDPPFNVRIAGHVCGLGKNQHAEFQMAAGEMSPAQFTAFLTESIGTMATGCMDGALLLICMDWRHMPELYAASASLGLTPINLCVWVKSNGGMGSLYRSQHELVLVLKKGKAPHVNNVELGKHGRYRTNVWQYAGMNSFSKERDEALAMHPTVKPVAMILDAIQDISCHGEIVLDFFLGSGTTLIAAQRCKRRCFGIEINPRYVDVALQRWISLTEQQPIHEATGQTFEQIKQARTAVVAAEGAV